MRTILLFVIVILMSSIALTQTLPAPPAITDPRQIKSRPNAQVEKNLSIEKLYMTRMVGGTTWSPDGKMIAFISNLSGRNRSEEHTSQLQSQSNLVCRLLLEKKKKKINKK